MAHQTTSSSSSVGVSVKKIVNMIVSVTLLAILLAFLVLPMPYLKASLSIHLDENLRGWLEYASYASEVLLVALFGEAIYSKSLGELVKERCADLERKNQEMLDNDPVLQADVNRLVQFWTTPTSQINWPDFRNAAGSAWRLSRRFQSHAFQMQIMIFGIARAMPGGVYGALALWLAVVHFGSEIALVQDLAPKGR